MRTIFIMLNLFMFPVLLATAGNAPTISIKGQIIDSVNSQPLSGVNVSILPESNLIGTITNSNGEFHLWELPANCSELLVSINGYNSKIVNIEEIRSTGNNNLIIKLEEKNRKQFSLLLKKEK